jgi:hypothetical protein
LARLPPARPRAHETENRAGPGGPGRQAPRESYGQTAGKGYNDRLCNYSSISSAAGVFAAYLQGIFVATGVAIVPILQIG